MDQKIQKCVSDTSIGQKQHIFTHITSKNHVLGLSNTPQLKLKTGPMPEKPGFIRKFHQFLGLWEMNQKLRTSFLTLVCGKNSPFLHIIVAKYIFSDG